MPEIKGSDLRSRIRNSGRDTRRHTIGFMLKSMDLLADCNARLISKILVKGIGSAVSDKSYYSMSIQKIAEDYDDLLRSEGTCGMMILDSRAPYQNSNVSHSLFTRKHRAGLDPTPGILEAPVFGHSENHVPLQLCDMICSAILSPIVGYVCCQSLTNSPHNHNYYAQIRARFSDKIRTLLYSYQDDRGRPRGGIHLRDQLGQQPVSNLLS